MSVASAAIAIMGLGFYSGALDVDTSKSSEFRRFALIVAANNGGADRVGLKYAETDADAFSKVLISLGGVAAEDTRRLNQPTSAGLRAAFSQLGAELAAAKDGAQRLELVMYYSGHSDADGLLLGSEQFSYRELKRQLAKLPVDVRIAVLDACSSGAMTRQKGGKRRPPFFVDTSNRVRGYAVITSSSEDEVAQESDNIQASFFTHYLVSGLRGAGDQSDDGRVTLSEAYHFAFHETLARTQDTAGGAQHPAYDIDLMGTGDVVMTDLRNTDSMLAFPSEDSGRFFIRDAQGHLAAEIRKIPGQMVELGLESGEYSILKEVDGYLYLTQATLVHGEVTELLAREFVAVDSSPTVSRGGAPRSSSLQGKKAGVDVNFQLGLVGLSSYSWEGNGVGGGLEAGGELRIADQRWSPLVGLSLGLTSTNDFATYWTAYIRGRVGLAWQTNRSLRLGVGVQGTIVNHEDLEEYMYIVGSGLQGGFGAFVQSTLDFPSVSFVSRLGVTWAVNEIYMRDKPYDTLSATLDADRYESLYELNEAVLSLLIGIEW